MKAPSESTILSAILQYLAYRQGVYAWRMNVGGVKYGDQYVKFGFKGLSDIIGILENGRFLAIEVKSKTGKQTDDQRFFQDQIEGMGGLYILARSLDDVADVINEVLPI